MVRTLTNQAYNDSPLLFFQTGAFYQSVILYFLFYLYYPMTFTASEDSYHYNTYYISVGVLILVILVTVVLVYIIYKIRRRNNQATITQEEDMMLIVNQKPLETTVIDFNSLQNHCSQPTFLTTLKIQFNVSFSYKYNCITGCLLNNNACFRMFSGHFRSYAP